MSKIAKIIEKNPNKILLFLGRVPNFTPQELRHFVEDLGMKYADTYQGEEPSDIALLVLSSMLTPPEEQLSYDLYDAGVEDVSLEVFEKFYTQRIQPNTLLMSLKLSNDQQKLRRMLQNEAFSDEIFLKLFGMLDWGSEGIYECDENRDMTIAFVKRFYRPDGFRDPAMIYAPTTVMNIAQESRDPKVLDAILSMPNHTIKVSRYETHRPKNLRETVAFNESIAPETIRRLMGYGDEGIDYFLAGNGALSGKELQRLYDRSTSLVRLMLAHNQALTDELFCVLLKDEERVVHALFAHQPITPTRLAWIKEHPAVAYVGKNPNIEEVVTALVALETWELDKALASNATLSCEALEILDQRYGEAIALALAHNPNLSVALFEKLYGLDRLEVLQALASNPATPKSMLDALCERHDRLLNPHLASNPSVEIRYLREFQLDTSLVRILANNSTYAQSVLSGLGL